MNSTIKRPLWAIGAGVAAALLTSGTALAQDAQEINVQATRAMNTKLVGYSSTGVPIVGVSLSYGVSTAGLDLATYSGAMELEGRVNHTAAAACKELGEKYPTSTPSQSECAKTASAKAMAKVHELVAAAEKAKK
jgi:UrcA family protein